MSDYAFHPEASTDLDEIWEYIAEDNIDAADGILSDVCSALATLAASPPRRLLHEWLLNRPGAESGDCPGRAVDLNARLA